MATCTVGGDHERNVAAAAQPPPGSGGQVWVDVDAGHLRRAEPLAQQSGGVARAGAHLQHPIAVLHLECLHHHRDQTGHGARGGHRVGSALGNQRGVGVDQPQPTLTVRLSVDVRACLVVARYQHVSWYREEGVAPAVVGQCAVVDQRGDHLAAQDAGLVGVDGGVGHAAVSSNAVPFNATARAREMGCPVWCSIHPHCPFGLISMN